MKNGQSVEVGLAREMSPFTGEGLYEDGRSQKACGKGYMSGLVAGVAGSRGF